MGGAGSAFAIGVLDYGFDLADVSKLDRSRPLRFGALPTFLDLNAVGTGSYQAVDVGLDVAVVARGAAFVVIKSLRQAT